MIAVELANLRTLVRERLDGDPLAKNALDTLLGHRKTGVDLRVALRHHRNGKVDDCDEIDLREGVDRVLALYSLLEIGCYARALADPVPIDVRSIALDVLTPAPVKAYYETHYPLALVSRFATRMRGTSSLRVGAPDAEHARSLYRAFLEVDRQIADDPEVQTFQRMLDDFSWGGVGLPALRVACQTPEAFGAALAGSPEVHKRVAMGARGLVEYLTFAARFDAVLKQAASVPGLTESFWLHYAYWFQQIGKRLGGTLDGLLSVFETWPTETGTTPATSELREVIARLVGGPGAYQA